LWPAQVIVVVLSTPSIVLVKISKIMTVAELIEVLKELPQDYTVTASTQDGGSYEVRDVYEHHEAFREVELS
jgi:hypothetical protein